MEDVDLDLDELLSGQIRPARFAPKASKFKPRLKAESSQTVKGSSASDELMPKGLESNSSPKKEKLAVKPEFANDVADMDIELKPEAVAENGVKKEETGDFMETEETEAEDEVVREIDVYFTPSIDANTQLYVFQYPLRPLWRPYELEEKCEEVRVKPASAEVEIDLAVDFESKNYDRNADPRVLMKKQTLASSWKPRQTSGYAVGVLVGDKLHLNPIHAVVQLRPSMKHLDSKESKRKNNVNPENNVKAEESEGKTSGISKKLSKPSGLNKNSAEDWIPLKYHGASSGMALGYLQKMAAREGPPIYFSMSSYDYLNSLCPGTSNDGFRSKGPSRRFLLTLPLKERFKTWLLEGPPIHRFDALKYLATDEPAEDVLEALQEHARLVQGLWVPKSSLVYGTDQGLEVLARDFVLLLFRKSVLINSSQIPQRPQLSKAMKDALKVLAVERPACGDWKLKEHPDFSFMKLNSAVVKKQEDEWDSLEIKINALLFGGKSGPSAKTSTKSNTTSNLMTFKNFNKLAMRTPNGSNSKTQMSEESREAITKVIQKLFKSVKVCSFQQISQRLRDMAVSESARSTGFAKEAVAAANSIDAFPNELQSIISLVAVNIHGVCVPKSSPDHPQYDSFRTVVINLFIAEGPHAKLKKAPIIEAAKLELKRDIPNIEYQKVLQELCVSQGSAWALRSGDGNPMH